MRKINDARLKKVSIILGMLIYFAGLTLFAYLSIYNRYFADDWCYNADLKKLGLIGALRGYNYITHYASNRYALTLFSGLLYPLGIFGLQIMTPLAIASWVMGLFWTLRNLSKITSFPLSRLESVLPAAIIVYYSIYLAPHLYQSIYWRSGLLPYTAPLVLSTLLFGLITYQGFQTKTSYLSISLIAFIAFIAGGFSEAGCTFLVTALGIYIIFASIGRQRKQQWASRSLPSAIIAFIFVILAMILLISSPTSKIRMIRYGEPASLIQLPVLVISFTLKFIRLSIIDTPLPYMVIVMTFSLLAFIVHSRSSVPIRIRKILFSILVVFGIAFALIAAAYAPSAYIEQVPPAPRTRIIMRFILIAALGINSWLIGYLLRQYLHAKWHNLVALFLLLFCYAYAARSIAVTSEKINIYMQRASIWDERDQVINLARDQGILEIDVRGIDGLPVGGIRDFKAKPGNWINGCAAKYYGVNEIRATLP